MRTSPPAVAAVLVVLLGGPSAFAADPPVPSGAHPRLFLSPSNLAGFTANAKIRTSAAAQLVARCQETIDDAGEYTTRGGSDGDNWPGAAMACAFAYRATTDAKYLTQALKYWKAALEDDATLGDKKGCTAAVANFDWRTKWNGQAPVPPSLLTVSHDTGYPIRWYGPYVSLTYDWLYDATGVDDALRAQTRSCMTGWVDQYTANGYLNTTAGANYHAGYAIAKTLAAIAIGNDGGADGHLWTETLHGTFADVLVGKGLSGSKGGIGDPAGLLVGGDWGSWQYGPLSILEYSVMTRAVEENGAPQPEMDQWVADLGVRLNYGLLPDRSAQFFGNGDFDDESVYAALNPNQMDAVLVGPSSDQAVGWAAQLKQGQEKGGAYIYNAIAELRTPAAQDYRAQTPAPPLWYLARGLGNMYVRTAWDDKAFWAVFMSGTPDADHAHLAASNFVFSRGADNLIVDSSNYGEQATFETNAVSADSAVAKDDYLHTQDPFGQPTLPWARGLASGVYAARADFAHAFDFQEKTDITYARREWVLLPEGEIVAIDRVHTSAAERKMYINFHTKTGGKLALDGATAAADVGSSRVVIHGVQLSGATPKITKVKGGNCTLSCDYPCGSCAAARFDTDVYSLAIAGPWAVGIHVIDGLASGEAPATVLSIGDDAVDPAPKHNTAVIGAAVLRSGKQSYVVAASAVDGAAGASMTYSVPGGTASRHIVYDAPSAADGTSSVTAIVDNGRCAVAIVAGGGGGMAGKPVAFQLDTAAGHCALTADADVASAQAPAGPGSTAVAGTAATAGKSDDGCGCRTVGARTSMKTGALALFFALGFFVRRRRAGS